MSPNTPGLVACLEHGRVETIRVAAAGEYRCRRTVSYVLTKLGTRVGARAVALGFEAGLIAPGALSDEGTPAG